MYNSIAANKRNTILIMAVFVGLIGAIGYAISWYYGNTSSTLIILAVAAVYALIQYFLASRLAIGLSGAEEIQKSDNPRLWRIVENLAITTGMPMPKVYIINDPAPNAFATGRNPKTASVGATTGLLEIMTDRELEAVMAHEMGHVRNYDIRVSTIAFGLVSVIGLLADLAFRVLLFGGNNDRNNSNVISLVIGVVIIIVAPLIASIIQMAISRQREYLADATGALTTRDSEGMASALGKLRDYGRPMQRQHSSTANLFLTNPLESGWFARLFSSHPPLDDRIARLLKNAEKF